MPAARREEGVSNKYFAPRTLSGLLEVKWAREEGRQGRAGRAGRAGQGRAGQGRAGQGRAGQGRTGQGRAGQGRAGQGRAGQGRAGRAAGQGGAGQGRAAGRRAGNACKLDRVSRARTGPGQAPGQLSAEPGRCRTPPCKMAWYPPRTGTRQPQKNRTTRVWVYLGLPDTAERSFAGRRHFRPRIPGGFTLPHRSDETLGRGASVGASSDIANGQRRSRQFRSLGGGRGFGGVGFKVLDFGVYSPGAAC